jgi:3-methyladenine DNA glycosylase/8-oxoguanine DNA glycosylase
VTTLHFDLTGPEPFCFEDTVFAHGWVRLLPYRWHDAARTLERLEALPSGRLARVSVRAPAATGPSSSIQVDVTASQPLRASDESALRAGLRWALVLDEGFGDWWRMCAEEPGLRQAYERRQGRMLRSPTVFEDLVKTVCSINTTWAQTQAMVRALVAHFGAREASLDETAGAFPTPAALASVDPAELRERARVGYRAETIAGLARSVVEGRLDLGRLADPALPDEEAAGALISLRGLGPYAVAHAMMLLGRYDFLPVDSWLRRTVREAWFGGRAASDREILASFERFRPYRSLAFRFYDWQGAMRREVWTAPEA